MKKLLVGLLVLGSVSTAFAQNLNKCPKDKIKTLKNLYTSSAELQKQMSIDEYLELLCDDGSQWKEKRKDIDNTLAIVSSPDYVPPKVSFLFSSKSKSGNSTVVNLPLATVPSGTKLYLHEDSNLNGVCELLGYGDNISSSNARVQDVPVTDNLLAYRIDSEVDGVTGGHKYKLIEPEVGGTRIIKSIKCENLPGGYASEEDHSNENRSNDRRGRKTCYAYLKLDPYIVGTVGYRLYVEKADGEEMLISTKKPGAIQGENTNQRSLEALIPGLERDLRRNYTCDNLVFEGIQQ